RDAFAILAVAAALPSVYVFLHRALIPKHVAHMGEGGKSSMDLLAIPSLRRTLIMSGVALTGIELFSFYLPIYGRAIGLAPSTIGLILSSYALAGFVVRIVMHRLAQRFTELGVLTGSLFLAALAYLAVAGLSDALVLSAAAFAPGLA